MKKYLLLCTALTISSSAYAALDCATPPTCEEWGFTMTTSDCAGQFSLKCPFDNTKLFCKGYKTKACAVGDVLYNDLKCYEGVPDPADKTPIAIVFNTGKKIAIGFERTSLKWATTTYCGSTGLYVSNSSADVLDDTQSGGIKTPTIVETNTTCYGSTSTAPGYCYHLTTGGVDEGKWFLPSMFEFSLLASNLDTVNTALTNNGAPVIASSGTYGGKHWTSSEAGSESAWLYDPNSEYSQSGGKTASITHVRCAISYDPCAYPGYSYVGNNCVSISDGNIGSAVVGPNLNDNLTVTP